MRKLLINNGTNPDAIDNNGARVTDSPGNAMASLITEALGHGESYQQMLKKVNGAIRAKRMRRTQR